MNRIVVDLPAEDPRMPGEIKSVWTAARAEIIREALWVCLAGYGI
jgi:hypothetical protein